jgi:hypothetical protein
MSDIPTVKVYENITPINSGTGAAVLEYDQLLPAVKEYKLSHANRSARAWESESGSFEELKSAKQLAMEYLLRTALQDIQALTIESRDLWSDRFTRASIELYGEPEEQEVSKLVSAEVQQWHLLEGDENVSQPLLKFLQVSYEKVFRPDMTSAPEDDRFEELEGERAAIEAYGEVLWGKYKPVFDLVDKADKEELTPEDLKNLFERAIKWLADNEDEGWTNWVVEFKNDTGVSSGGKDRKIRIGKRRVNATPDDARELIAHELFVHGLRSQNAHKGSDEMLITGYPGFLDAEEGLGKLSEQAVGGITEEPGRDRYMDIAIALKKVNGVQITRQELFGIHLARDIVKAQSKEEFDGFKLADMTRTAWASVDRVYRGGRANEDGSRQAVYTKDLAYYIGYKKMAQYLRGQLARGKSMNEIFEYVTLGSFDPTNPKDTERVAKS